MERRWTAGYAPGTTTVDEILAVIEQLPFDDQARITRMVMNWTDDAWDQQIAADCDAGRLDELVGEVDVNIDAGRHGRFREVNAGHMAGGVAGG